MDDRSTTISRGSVSLPIILAGMVFVGIVGLVAVRSMQNSASSQTMQPVDNTASVSPAAEIPETSGLTTNGITGTNKEVRTITIEAGSFYYKPNQIRMKKGETVAIVLDSRDMMHDFNIDELGVKIPVTKAGTTSTVEFTAEKVGSFEYYCSVGQHRKNGQVGTIIIE